MAPSSPEPSNPTAQQAPPCGHFDSDRELREFYSDRLRFAWEKWLFLIHAIIGFAGATVLLFLNSMNVLDKQVTPAAKPFLVWSIGFGMASLAFAILWRFAAQHFMEAIILGCEVCLERYEALVIKRKGIMYGPEQVDFWHWNAVFKALYYLGFILSLVFLALSWIFGILFIVRVI